MSTNEQEGTCVVHFLGYGNEEEVWIGDLLASQGKHARAQQELAAQGYFADNIDVEAKDPTYQHKVIL
ncbi:survival motor neuron protein-like [Tachypleus tridentatus]|uniref:survival motor neuron protein-like n=1 Tax=Tachypleus tridentatus TaxID=6853 RepID=UPI003FD2B85A